MSFQNSTASTSIQTSCASVTRTSMPSHRRCRLRANFSGSRYHVHHTRPRKSKRGRGRRHRVQSRWNHCLVVKSFSCHATIVCGSSLSLCVSISCGCLNWCTNCVAGLFARSITDLVSKPIVEISSCEHFYYLLYVTFADF